MSQVNKEDGWSRIASEEVGAVLLQRAPSQARAGRSLLFRKPDHVIAAWQPHQVLQALDLIETRLAQGFYLAGYLAYEAGFALEPALTDLAATWKNDEPLLWFGCYKRPERRQDSFPLASEPAVSFTPVCVRYGHLQQAYERQVNVVRDLISAGQTYQLNLTMDADWTIDESPAELYERLLQVQPVPYAALLHPQQDRHIVSLSPELFLARNGDRVRTRPMKGTAPPGLDLAETEAQAARLHRSEKDRAENVMIVDLLRNDLNRVCRIGSVQVTKLFQVERHPTVLQMTSTVEGRLRPDVRYRELFAALFPSGSIVGAPKIHSMRLLAGLEGRPRGVYTGAIGYIAPNAAEFSVAIRTVSVRGKRARLSVGSGITFDSDPALEFAECMTKTMFLRRQPDPPFELVETLLHREGEYLFLEEHLARIAQSAQYFDFAFDEEAVRRALHAAASSCGTANRVRLLLSRGGEVTCTTNPAPSKDHEPVGLLLHHEKTSSLDRFLRHKTTRRPLYDRALQQAQSLLFADSLFQNTREEVTEGAIHNVLARLAGEWITPPLQSGVLPGIYRQHLLRDGQVKEQTFSLAELLKADLICICNSVRGLRRVGHLARVTDSGTLETLWTGLQAESDDGILDLVDSRRVDTLAERLFAR